MIQRIQTVYLLIVAALLAATMCLPLATFTDAAGVYEFSSLGIHLTGAFHSTWGLTGILGLSIVVALGTIFLYKNRTLQIRMTIFNSLLLVGYYLAFAAFYFALQNDEATFSVKVVLFLPLAAILLNGLAIRAIGRDDVMVKAADRLR